MDQPHQQQRASEGAAGHPRRQVETPVAGIVGLFIARYPSGRRTFVYRYRSPRTGKKTSITLGRVDE